MEEEDLDFEWTGAGVVLGLQIGEFALDLALVETDDGLVGVFTLASGRIIALAEPVYA